MKNLVVRTQTLRGLFARFVAIVLPAALLTAAPFHAALAATAPSLGAAGSFAVLGASTVTNTGPTVIIGDLGIAPGLASSVTGFPPGTVLGTIYAGPVVPDLTATLAQGANTAAYLDAQGRPCGVVLTGQDLGSVGPLVPGVYCFGSSAQLTGTLTLDAGGDPNAFWVFQIGSALTTASNSKVLLVNGGNNCNVFWQVTSSAVLGTTTSFIGNILALASITLNTGANVFGRTLAQTGAVTLDSNLVTTSACGAPAPPGGSGITLYKAFQPAAMRPGEPSTLTITLRNFTGTVATLTAPLIDILPSGVKVAGIPKASTTCVGGVVTALPGGLTVILTGGSIPANGSCNVRVDVIAPSGSYSNSLAAGALQTSNGNNAASAAAPLIVKTFPPVLTKSFSPVVINAGGVSTLTITLKNPPNWVATLTAPLTDTLPSGVKVAGIPNASTTCGGPGLLLPVLSGDTAVTLKLGSTIPAGGSCTVKVDVTAPSKGTYLNRLAAGALQTSNGSYIAPTIAVLLVVK
jgi:uncharacterized repeat protein (TIGR01451 family)